MLMTEQVRHGHRVCLQFKRESEGGRSFTVSTIRLWNRIFSEIRNKQNLIGFKKSMLEHFVSSYKDQDYFVM